jgi:hypothetical protein
MHLATTSPTSGKEVALISHVADPEQLLYRRIPAEITTQIPRQLIIAVADGVKVALTEARSASSWT